MNSKQLFTEIDGNREFYVRFSCEDGTADRRAVSKGEIVQLSFSVPTWLALSAVTVALYPDGQAKPQIKETAPWSDRAGAFDCFSVSLDTSTVKTGLYWLTVTGHTHDGCLFGMVDGDRCFFVDDEKAHAPLQLTVYDRKYPTCDWLEGGIVYHIFVDRFAKGDPTPLQEGAVRCDDWENGTVQYPAYPGAPLKNNQFFGGNLSGIIQKLPYLASLGVSCLYLSPIFKAKSNHKYDTADYMEIDPAFGDEAIFAELIQGAKAHGMRIILDGVFNHTGSDSRYFNRYGTFDTVGAYQSRTSPYAGWYFFKQFPHDYESWWGIEILPKLNLKDKSCRSYFLGENGVIAHYASLGIGGMRLDVADELDDDFIATVKRRLCDERADNVLFGEVWEDASNKIAYDTRKTYYLGSELDGVMNYPLRTGILSYLKEGNPEPLRYALGEIFRNAPKEVADMQMNLLGSHDTERVLSMLGDISYKGKTNDEIATMRMTAQQRQKAIALLKMAYAIQATVPGVPSIYYGDEAGMEGYKDPFNRYPYPWHNQAAELLSHYRAVGRIRRAHKVYARGAFSLLYLDSDALVFAREGEGERFITAVNRSKRTLIIETDGTDTLLLYGHTTAGKVTVPPMSCAIFQTDGKHAHIYF